MTKTLDRKNHKKTYNFEARDWCDKVGREYKGW